MGHAARHEADGPHLLGSAEPLLELLPQADVVDERLHDLRSLLIDARGTDIHRRGGAVSGAHLSLVHVGCALLDSFVDSVRQARRVDVGLELIGGHVQQLVATEARERLGRAVHTLEAAGGGIDDQNGVVGLLEEGGQLPLCLLEVVVRGLQLVVQASVLDRDCSVVGECAEELCIGFGERGAVLDDVYVEHTEDIVADLEGGAHGRLYVVPGAGL